MKKTDRILVTGASGFIGSHLLRLLYQKGYRNLRATSYVRGLRKDFEGSENIPHYKGNLQDAKFCKEVSDDIDVVFHCAANTSNALDTKFNPLLHVILWTVENVLRPLAGGDSIVPLDI
jgi:nucleoside-diphosphate-sugar epimerase